MHLARKDNPPFAAAPMNPGTSVRSTPISDDQFRYSSGSRYPNAVNDFQLGHELLEQIPCDVLITPHPGASNFRERASNAPEGLVDQDACKRYALRARRQLNDRLTREST